MLKGQRPIPITAAWLRRNGEHIEVLLEMDGQFRKVITEHADGPISHICESLGILASPWEPIDSTEPEDGG